MRKMLFMQEMVTTMTDTDYELSFPKEEAEVSEVASEVEEAA